MPDRILFVVSSVTGNQLTRAYPFADLLLQEGRTIEIIGPGRENKDTYIKDPRMDILPIPRLPFRDRIKWIGNRIAQCDIVCVSKPCWWGTLSAAIAKHADKKLIFDIDDDDLRTWAFDIRTDVRRVGVRRTLSYLPNGLIIKINFSSRRLADRLLVASTFLKHRYGGEIVYVPVDERIFHGKPKEVPGDKIIMYAGAIRAHKGIETLIDSFRLVRDKVPDAKLYLVGPIERSLLSWGVIKKKIKDIPDVVCPGFQPTQTIPDWLAKADCLVIPSPDNPIHRAQSPVKLMYYMGSGRPIIATPVGEVPLILRQEESALMVPPEDPVSMSDSIVRILTSPDLSKRLGDTARIEFLDRYCSGANRDRIEKLFSFDKS